MKNDANAIFVGRVKSITMENEPLAQPMKYKVVLTVIRSWKSPKQTEYVIHTNGGCIISFKEDQEYLVYAEIDKAGALFTDMCMGTGPLQLGRKDFKYLGNPIFSAQNADISGTLTKGARNPFQ